MKQLMSIILVFSLLFAVAACTKQSDGEGRETSRRSRRTTTGQSIETVDSTTLSLSSKSTTAFYKDNEFVITTSIPTTARTTARTMARTTARTTTRTTERTTMEYTTRPLTSNTTVTWTATTSQTHTNTTTKAPVNDGVLSSFSSKDLNGNTVNQSVFRGKKLTMVNVWATFCGPCINEMPALAALNNSYASQGFQIVGIVSDAQSDTNIDRAKSILSSAGATYKNLLPSSSLNSALLNDVEYVPTTIFVDENGAMVGEVYIGSRSEEAWAAIIDDLLEQV